MLRFRAVFNYEILQNKTYKIIAYSIRFLSGECVTHSVSLYVQSKKDLVRVVVPVFNSGNAAKSRLCCRVCFRHFFFP